MKSVMRTARRYLLQPENGAGLLYVALAFALLAHWAQHLVAGASFVDALAWMFSAQSPERLFHAWTLISFAISAWLAFLLLRRRLTRRAMRRVLLVVLVHALGAIRFYDLGLMLLSVLPLFALLPAYLLPDTGRER